MKVLQEKHLYFEVEVDASIEDVWRVWTTNEGIKSFLARDCNVEPRTDGKFEIYFDPGAPFGSRGSEGCRILSFEEKNMLTFSWNSPPRLREVREQKTFVILRFKEAGDTKTSLSLTHIGWGESDQWNESYQYFKRAWGEIVLPRLKRRFTGGPIEWDSTN